MLEQIAVNMEFRGGAKVKYYHIKDNSVLLAFIKNIFIHI